MSSSSRSDAHAPPRAGRSAAIVTEASERRHVTASDGIEITTWTGTMCHDGSGTAFVLVLDGARVTVAEGTYPLPAGSYAVLPSGANVEGGSGVTITDRSFRGLFHIGGAVEPRGRLRYIDGCSDTLLVAPVVRGDPCLNLLHVPPATVQSDHEHPSLRVGLVVKGSGSCVLRDRRERMRPGSVFVLPARTTHRFETDARDALLVMAWHADSDTGPTDDEHPMLNGTLRPGSTARAAVAERAARCDVLSAPTTSGTSRA